MLIDQHSAHVQSPFLLLTLGLVRSAERVRCFLAQQCPEEGTGAEAAHDEATKPSRPSSRELERDPALLFVLGVISVGERIERGARAAEASTVETTDARIPSAAQGVAPPDSLLR